MTPEEKFELNKRVHNEIFGKELFTQGYMKELAEEVWKEQPHVVFFMYGFSLKSGRFYNFQHDRSPDIDLNLPVVFEQHIPDYLGKLEEAWKIFEHFEKLGWSHTHSYYHGLHSRSYHVSLFKSDTETFSSHADDIKLAIILAGLAVNILIKNSAIEEEANKLLFDGSKKLKALPGYQSNPWTLDDDIQIDQE